MDINRAKLNTQRKGVKWSEYKDNLVKVKDIPKGVRDSS